MQIRSMEMRDLDKVYLIEQMLYKTPWSREMFIQEISTNAYAYFFVAEEAEHIIGYYGFWLVMDEAMITKISVIQPLQRRGIGKILLQDLLQRLTLAQASQVSLEVRLSNAPAIHLYESFGFKKAGIRRHYYSDGEDAYAMIKTPTTEKGEIDGHLHTRD